MRNSGILLPVSALPSEYGIGTFGEEAYKFVDFLCSAKQKFWQILPLGHTGYGDSPYQCFSAFAGNPYFIDLNQLVKEGYLSETDLPKKSNSEKIEYGKLFSERIPLIKKAASAVKDNDAEFVKFRNHNEYWLDGYALFMAIKENEKMKPLEKWKDELRCPDEKMFNRLSYEFYDKASVWKKVQYLFFEQWKKLKEYANSMRVEIIGDVPVYVSPDSAEMWLNKELFLTDENLNPKFSAGCPPDEFSPLGQLWGNPLYDWDFHKNSGYDWWLKRLSLSSEIYDVVRIDHFRGFEDFYAVPSTADNAVSGVWFKGPSKDFIDAVKSELPNLRVIAEDLGNITDEVRELVEYSGYPGMKILQFAFDGTDNSFLPHNYNYNCVAYTGTHDNPTMKQWMLICNDDELLSAKKYLAVNNKDTFVNDCIRALYSSVCRTVIIPIQDWLNLGVQARINVPSIADGNWVWRADGKDFTQELAQRIREMTELYFRNREETI